MIHNTVLNDDFGDLAATATETKANEKAELYQTKKLLCGIKLQH